MSAPHPQLRRAALPIVIASGLFAALYALTARFNDLACTGQLAQPGARGNLLTGPALPVFALIFLAFFGAFAAPFLSRLPLQLTGWIGIAAPMLATLWTVLSIADSCESGFALAHAAQVLALLWGLGGALIVLGRVLHDPA
ncbi:MAG: hypothetical protein R3D78_02720 [Paracoccaceae bacterium]